MRRTGKQAGSTTPSPPRSSGRMAGRGNGKRGGPPADEASGTQDNNTRPQERNRPTRKMTGRTAIANERERESDMGMKQAGRSQQCPQPQIDSSQRLPRPGAGEQFKQAERQERARGGRARGKRYPASISEQGDATHLSYSIAIGKQASKPPMGRY